MNNKITIGAIVVVIIVGGIFFIMNQSSMMQQNNPTQQQIEAVSSPAIAKNAVTIQNMAFSPATLSIKVGDKVTWTNQDSVGHSATADDSSFDTGVIAQGQSVNATFSKAGTYTYHCSVHPNMKGTIIVTQ